MSKTTVLIASGSVVSRMKLRKFLTTENDFDVVGSCGNAVELQEHIERLDPDITLISQCLTHDHDFHITRAFLETVDVRWLTFIDDGAKHSAFNRHLESDLFSIDLRTSIGSLPDQIRAVCRAKRKRAPRPVRTEIQRSKSQKLVVMGSSTGGIDALINILSRYPTDCPPTAIVQHTRTGFGKSLVRLLNQRSPANVVEAQNGMTIEPGTVCIAAGGDTHLTVLKRSKFECKFSIGEAVYGHRPSIGALFDSVLPHSHNTVAVLLTGMGQDGSKAITRIRKAGGTTIGQDEATSVVYGMPRAAMELGGLTHILPIDKIADAILKNSDLRTVASSHKETLQSFAPSPDRRS